MLFFGHNSSVSAPILLIFSAKEEPNHYPIIFYAKNKDSRQLWIIGLISYLPWDTVQRCVLTGFFCFLSCIRGYLHRYVDFLDFTGSLYLNWTSEVILTIQVCTQCTQGAQKVHTRSILSNFLNGKVYSDTKNKAIVHLVIWRNWCFGQFYDSKIEK